MPAHRKTSLRQIIELITYLEKHRDIKLGTVVPRDKKIENEHWQKLTRILNTLPGETKDTTKWRSFWAELKWRCRKKAAGGGILQNFEKRVLSLVGMVSSRPVSNIKIEPQGNFLVIKPDSSYSDMDFADNSRLSDNHELTADPMATPDLPEDMYPSDKEEEQQEEQGEQELNNAALNNEDIPEWVRRVEHSRLELEERTTRAIEQMSTGITTMAEAMKTIAGSLQNIEASIRSINNTS